MAGWKIDGGLPEVKKYMIIVAPHTSNWDFFVGWGAKNVLNFHPNFLGKKELFQIPVIGWFLTSIGGVAVDRKNKAKTTQLVEQVIRLYKEREEFIMTIAPEGTRSYAPKWKTGFYRIAQQANVPIVKIGFDFKSKTVFVDEPIYPTGDMENEMNAIQEYFKQFQGKNPENGVR